MFSTRRSTSAPAEEIVGRYFPVLDHGFVSLVDYMGGDEDIERAARVSYGAGTRKQSDTRGLLRYLRRHKHTTPTEMVELKFHCAMPIFIARQWIRHRTANVNEASGRYSLMPMLFYTPENAQLKHQSTSNKQGRAGAPVTPEDYKRYAQKWAASRQATVEHYQSMTQEDVARELARIDLPLSTYTQWYWKIDLHNLLHFLTLRVDSHAQWEIQEFGRVMAGMVKRVSPLTYEAWLDYDVCGARFSRSELATLDAMLKGSSFEAASAGSDLSKRELSELKDKLSASRERPDFTLDVAKSVDPEHFADRYAKAVLPVDQVETM